MTDRTRTTRRAFLRRSAVLAGAVTAVGALGACDSDGDGQDGGAAPSDSSTTTAGASGGGAAAVARAAFYAGFPLVTTMRTMQTFAELIGVNRVFVTGGLAIPTSRFVVAPNRDTVYALTVLDLRAGPQVLTVPDIPDRYHVFQFIDAWMGGFGLIGTRTRGGRGGVWVIVPPGNTVDVPRELQRLDSPTTQAILLGRIRAVDDADAVVAAAIGPGIQLTSLAERSGGAAPVAPAMTAPAGSAHTTGTNGLAYFDELGDALAVNPPVAAAPRAAITAAAGLGVGPGLHPSVDAGATDARVLNAAVTAGLRELEDDTLAGAPTVNGWSVNLEVDELATEDGLQSLAVLARSFWGPVPPEEAVYPRAIASDDGQPLDGARRYVIHFAPGELPPVDAFWSVTAYGPDMFLVPNAPNRYSISGDTPGLAPNADGSLDVYLQAEAPSGREANWRPSRTGPSTSSCGSICRAHRSSTARTSTHRSR